MGLLTISLALGVIQLWPPEAVPKNVSKTEFSSARAMDYLAVIAARPRPIGSPEATAARDFIIRTLAELGFHPEVQVTGVVSGRQGALVHNVVARLDGSKTDQAILLVAHYDSVPNSPGASDDGAGVSALIETARALKAGPSLSNSVILLFTDGEEPGLLGAQGFQQSHRWAQDVRLVLNFEARGSSGPSIMFETSSHNEWLIREFIKSAPHAIGNSLTYEIYRLLPNDTDFTVFKKAGLAGMNFAYFDRVSSYHNMQDSSAMIDERSLQHNGANALALTRHFGELNLERQGERNVVYFNVLGKLVLAYPQFWVIPIAGVALSLFVALLLVGRKRKRLNLRGTLFGTLVFSSAIIGVPLVATGLWSLVVAIHPEYRLRPGDQFNTGWYRLAMTLFAIGHISLLYQWSRRKTSPINLWAGALLCWVLLAVITALLLPGASYLFVWPLLFAELGLAFLVFRREPAYEEGQPVAVLLSVVPGIVLVVPMIQILYMAFNLEMVRIPILLIILLFGALLPLYFALAEWHRWFPSLTACAGCLLLLVASSVKAGFSSNWPRPTNLFYATIPETGKAVWASLDPQLNEWTSKFMTQKASSEDCANYAPIIGKKCWISEATYLNLDPPRLEKIEDQNLGEIRRVRLRISSPRRAAAIHLSFGDTVKVLRASVNDQQIGAELRFGRLAEKSPWQFSYWALPPEGIELVCEINSVNPLIIRIVDQSYGFTGIPLGNLPLRPDYMMPGGANSDAVFVSATVAI
jgi:hypothetical protein